MAWFNSPVRDWKVFYPHGKRKFGYRTLQQGTTSFGRKKKNGCRLTSSADIRRAVDKAVGEIPKVTYKVAFPKIPLAIKKP